MSEGNPLKVGPSDDLFHIYQTITQSLKPKRIPRITQTITPDLISKNKHIKDLKLLLLSSTKPQLRNLIYYEYFEVTFERNDVFIQGKWVRK